MFTRFNSYLNLALFIFGVMVTQTASSATVTWNSGKTVTIDGVTYSYCADAPNTCSFTGSAKVVFGYFSSDSTQAKYSVNGPFTNSVGCSVGQVASTDPAYGYGKKCYFALVDPSAAPQITLNGVTYTYCADQYDYCAFNGSGEVVFGYFNSTTAKYSINGPITSGVSCSVGSIGSDSAPGYAKKCYYAPSSPTVSCTAPSLTTTQATNGLISVDTPSSDGTRLWKKGASFPVEFTTDTSASDTVSWTIADQLGKVRGGGSFAVAAGAQTHTLTCTSSYTGYLAIRATLVHAGGSLPAAGTRPAGISTFGILPNLTGALPAVTYTHQDQHRFGMQGFTGDFTMLADLGVSQALDDRELSKMEKTGPNTWTPSLLDANIYKNGLIERLIRLDGIPAWASPTGAETRGYAPTNLTYYQNFMARVGTDTSEIRKAYYPNEQYDYYQVSWEPEVNWKDTQANFVAMYKAVYNGIHSTDPQAIVMGPTTALLNSDSVKWLQELAPLGFANYVDGITIHGYYNGYNTPIYPPETTPTATGGLDQQMRALRAEMQAEYKPNMKLFSTEAGISYNPHTPYGSSAITTNLLYAQASVAARTHIILLGEGAQVSYFFFGPDYANGGFGTFFDLVDPTGSAGATDVSPKPDALALATLAHVLDGTNTLGYLKNLPANVHGYSFQQLNGGKVITALWVHNSSVWPDTNGVYESNYTVPYSLNADASGTSGTLTVIDAMGNISTVPYTNGVANLTLSESPIYVVSSNATVMKANVTVPLGYTGQ